MTHDPTRRKQDGHASQRGDLPSFVQTPQRPPGCASLWQTLAMRQIDFPNSQRRRTMDSYDAPPRRNLADTLIFHRLNDLACLWYVHTKRFSKLDRYTLGQKVFELLVEMLVLVIRAQYQPIEQKLHTLNEISAYLDSVKVIIRITRKLEIVSEVWYIRFEDELCQVGKMLGGWIRDTRTKSPKAVPGAPG